MEKMSVMVPEVKNCCFCVPLRWGIISFAYVNIIFTVTAAASLLLMNETLSSETDEDSLEGVTATVLFSIFGMSVILNILLVIAEFQKDESMLRLYNLYSLPTALAALIPTFILLSRLMLFEVCFAFFAITMQFYVIILVRSEINKLETMEQESESSSSDAVIAVSDTDTLL